MQDITKKEMFSKWKVEVKDVKWFWGSGCQPVSHWKGSITAEEK